MPDGSIPVDKLFFTPEQAGAALEMGLDEIENWMSAGYLNGIIPLTQVRREFPE